MREHLGVRVTNCKQSGVRLELPLLRRMEMKLHKEIQGNKSIYHLSMHILLDLKCFTNFHVFLAVATHKEAAVI